MRRGQIQTRYKKEIFDDEGCEALAQAFQRGGKIPVNIQSQAGWGSEQPHLVKDISAHCRGIRLDDL